jgi:hypothetical protein
VLEGVVVVAGVVVLLLRWMLLHWRFVLLLEKSINGLLQLCLHCSLFLDLLLHRLSSLHDCPSSGHVLLQEPKVFILLVKECQLVLYDGFDSILSIDADLLELRLLSVGLDCDVAASTMMKEGDLGQRC